MLAKLLRPGSDAPSWSRWLASAAGVWIGLVLVFAGVAKGLEPEAFAEAIRHLGIGSFQPVPEAWGFPLAVVAIALEIALGVALLVGHRTLPVVSATAGLLIFFVLVTVVDIVSGKEGCGCFGSIVTRTPERELVWLVVYLVTLTPAFLARPPRSTLTWIRGILVGAAAAVGLVLPLAAPWLPSHGIASAIGRVIPGSSVPDRDPRASLDLILPELWAEPGPHIVVMTSLDEGPALEPDTVERLNLLAGAYDLPAQVFVLIAAPPGDVEPEERYNELVWSVGLNLPDHDRVADPGILEFYNVQWSLRGDLDPAEPVPRRLVRASGSFLPRTFLIEEARVTRVWSGVPGLEEVASAVGLEAFP